MIALIALDAGGVAALPFVSFARRELVVLRLRPLADGADPRHPLLIRLRRELRRGPLTATIVRLASVPRLRRDERRRAARFQR